MKKGFLFIGIMFTLLILCSAVFAESLPTVTLTVNGESKLAQMQVWRDVRFLIQAPEATAVRVFDPNRYNLIQPNEEVCWD